MSFSPRLPHGLTRLAINLAVRGRRLRIEISPQLTRYRLLEGEPLEVGHDDTTVRLDVTEPVSRATGQPTVGDAPRPPVGRAPASRRRLLSTHERS